VEAKVDIRKLQFLNDRIAQVTDALNQVRLSVHGLQQGPFGQQPQLGVQQQGPYGPGPFGFQPSPYYGGVPFGPQAWQPGLQSPMIGGGLGLQHASYGPYAQYPPQPIQSIQGLGQMGWPSYFGGGLYHSPAELVELRLGEQRAIDPNRILQTFPLCLVPGSTATSW